MKKVALYAFNGDPVCFIHVLLNALDMKEKGYDIKLIIEGSAARLVRVLALPEAPLHKLYEKVKEEKLIDCVCKACIQNGQHRKCGGTGPSCLGRC